MYHVRFRLPEEADFNRPGQKTGAGTLQQLRQGRAGKGRVRDGLHRLYALCKGLRVRRNQGGKISCRRRPVALYRLHEMCGILQAGLYC